MSQALPTKLITAEEVINFACESVNFDEGFILDKTIIGVQYDELFSVLGKDYYNELLIQSLTSYTSANQIIIDRYVKPFLAYKIKSRVMAVASFKMTNAGIVQNSGEFVERSMVKDVDYARNEASQMGDSFKWQLVAYLNDEDYIDSYPTYRDDETRTPLDLQKSVLMGGIIINRRSANT